MKALGIAFLIVILGVAALQIGGIAFALMEGRSINGVYPWSLPLAEARYSQDSYLKAWGVVAAVPVLTAGFIAILAFMPGRSSNHGSARFARALDLKKQNMLSKSGVILGKTRKSDRAPFIRQDEQTHTLLVAPTGSGKGVGVIIPNLLTYGGSVVCVDVKGENWTLTASARKSMGDKVYRFSPRALDACSHRWNPLSYISPEPARRISELRTLATYLFPVTSTSADSWVRGARNIFVGICLYVLDHGEQKTLGAVYRAVFGPYGFQASLKAILKTPNLDPECQRLLAQYTAFAEDQLSGYIGSLEPLNLWGDPLVDAATAGDDFDLRKLRSDPMSIYLAVNAGEVEELAPLLRMFFQQVIDLLQASEPGPDELYPVLMVMDEFRTLGKLEKVLSAVTTIRSYGGRFMIVVQGLANLVEVYGREGRDNILQNCGYQVFHAMNDEGSGEYVRKRLGRQTVKQMSKSYGAGRTPSRNYSETGKDLMSLDEIGRLDDNRNIIIVEGGWPVKGWRIRYYDEPRFASLVAAPPELPLLKPVATLRPATAPPPAPAPAQADTAPTDEGGSAGLPDTEEEGGEDRFSVARAQLAAASEEIERDGTSWRVLAHEARKAQSEGGDLDAGVNATITAEIERRIDATDGTDNPDARFSVAHNAALFREFKHIADNGGFPAIGEEIDSVNDIMADLHSRDVMEDLSRGAA